MAIGSVLWKLASPYDAYVSHVARLNHAIERIRYFNEMAQRQQAGIDASVRVGSGEAPDAVTRSRLFRERLAVNAKRMSDEEFEEFIAVLGGGHAAVVESNRERAIAQLGHSTRGLEEYFAVAGQELATLEKRGYSPGRTDVARQLRENGLPQSTLAEYRHQLRELGARADV